MPVTERPKIKGVQLAGTLMPELLEERIFVKGSLFGHRLIFLWNAR